jgi:hypothetical protein
MRLQQIRTVWNQETELPVCLSACSLGLLFNPNVRGRTLLRKLDKSLPDHKVSHRRRYDRHNCENLKSHTFLRVA